MKNSVKSMTRFNGDTVYHLPSIVFNNKKPINGIFNVFFVILIFTNIVFHMFDDIPLFFLFYFPTSLVVLYLLSPRTLVLGEDGIRYYSIWKRKWSEIKDFSLKNDVLTLNTFEGKTYVVKNINSDIAKEIIDFINKKINVKT